MRAVPWAYAMLRGSKVLAKAREDGTLVADGEGRVEIRYRQGDARAYRAAARNLARADGEGLLPDDACPPAEAAPAKGSSTKSAGGKSAKGTKAAPAPVKVPDGAWIAYTDGACSGNPGPAGLGIVVIEPGVSPLEGYEYLGQATNNVAELTAVLRALELIPASAHAVIHTDSQYTIGIVTKGWKPKANQELVARLRAALEPRKRLVKLAYVPGHAGVPLNERADELAREAVRTRDTRLPRHAKTTP